MCISKMCYANYKFLEVIRYIQKAGELVAQKI